MCDFISEKKCGVTCNNNEVMKWLKKEGKNGNSRLWKRRRSRSEKGKWRLERLVVGR